MTGGATLVPRLEEARLLHRTAERMGGPTGAAIQLCLLTMSTPWQVVAIDLEAIDWGEGAAHVHARGVDQGRRRRRIVPLSNAAIHVLLRCAGSAAGRGQAVTGGRGEPIAMNAMRLDRLKSALARIDPATLNIRWNFQGLRRLGACTLRHQGAGVDDVRELLGLRTDRPFNPYETGHRHRRAVALAERWSRTILTDPGGTLGACPEPGRGV
ncbi:MAG: site-specific integrase [Sphingomonas adhaesiva]|uniref:site-specific integrase n=1 Tax=Sphingomonas adhaesiva TaxID=28212 RepID=UPI002FF90056